MKAKTPVRLLKAAIWLGALGPVGWLATQAFQGELGVNPIEEVIHFTGLGALILLLVTLAVTPLRKLTGWNRIVQVRRLLGLFAFFYATLHMLSYVGLDQFFAWEYILEDVAERPFITAGFTAFVLLIPLAVTSTRGWIRRLGRNWARLHKLVYVAAALGVLHFFWLVKADTRLPLIFAAILAVLLAFRLFRGGIRLRFLKRGRSEKKAPRAARTTGEAATEMAT